MSENENKKVIYQKSVGISALPYVFAAVVLPALIVYIGEKVISQELGDINRILIGTAVILLLGGVVTFIAYKKLNSIIQTIETKQMAEDVKILSDYFTQIEESLLRIGGYMEETNEANSINQTHMTNIDINGKKSNETLKTLMESIFEVNDYIQKVQTMTKVISDISDQTNLLALNASIEAAHAGEQGKGFAVVAEEVRKLAEQSTIASNDISEIIEIVQEKSKEMVDNVRQTSENGATQSNAIKETLSSAKIVSDQVILVTNEISETIKLTDEMKGKKDFLLNSTKEILLVAENNAAGIEEVSANTEEILATMEEFSANIAEMNVISHQLKEKTDLFITQDNKEATLKIIEKLKK